MSHPPGSVSQQADEKNSDDAIAIPACGISMAGTFFISRPRFEPNFSRRTVDHAQDSDRRRKAGAYPTGTSFATRAFSLRRTYESGTHFERFSTNIRSSASSTTS
jgi:hypothetical protein